MGKKKGLCSICGKGRKLSFEHIPPASTFNNQPTVVHTYKDWLDSGGGSLVLPGGNPQPKGAGYATICKGCNEYSGAHYVPTFGTWVKTAHAWLREIPLAAYNEDVASHFLTYHLLQTRPLPFIKQVVAMLLALNGESAPEFRLDNSALVSFAMNKEQRTLPEQYRIYLSLFAGPTCRYSPVTKMEKNGATVVSTSIDYPPFSYVMTLAGTAIADLQEITGFSRFGLHEEVNVELRLRCGFGHSLNPLDYRSQARISSDIAAGVNVQEVRIVGRVLSDGTVLRKAE